MQDAGIVSLAQKLAPMLDPLQGSIKDMHWRLVPSAFISTDPFLRALPLPIDWKWPTIAAHLLRFKPQTLILQLPSFWQLEPYAHFASRAAGAPVCNIEPQNFPLDKAAIRLASADAILAEATEASALAEYLTAEQVELPPSWMLVHAGDAPVWETGSALKNGHVQVAHEVHLAPGIPLLIQCEHLSAQSQVSFHLSELFTWGKDLSTPSITTLNTLLFTLTDFSLPFSLEDTGTCTCGKPIVRRVG